MQGFNRYYPPDYDPSKNNGNLNKLAGKAPQRNVVRFEMPYNVSCASCNKHIAQGVRFNARKTKSGSYFTSPIFLFSMTCYLCSGVIEIRTNPKETCYDVVSGAVKRADAWAGTETGITPGKDLDEDPIYKLEVEATRRQSKKDAETHVTQLIRANERQWSDPYTQSQRLRATFRRDKKLDRERSESRASVNDRFGLSLPILDRTSDDLEEARRVGFARPATSFRASVARNTRNRNNPF